MQKAWWVAAFFLVFVIGGIEIGLRLSGLQAESKAVKDWSRIAADLLVVAAVSWRCFALAFGTRATTP
jgi:hypothetical protein